METTNTILVSLILVAAALLALTYTSTFHKFVAYAFRKHSHTGVRILRRQAYRDVETQEVFETWSTVRGFRLRLVSTILKF
jgi:hypothetical protein